MDTHFHLRIESTHTPPKAVPEGDVWIVIKYLGISSPTYLYRCSKCRTQNDGIFQSILAVWDPFNRDLIVNQDQYGQTGLQWSVKNPDNVSYVQTDMKFACTSADQGSYHRKRDWVLDVQILNGFPGETIKTDFKSFKVLKQIKKNKPILRRKAANESNSKSDYKDSSFAACVSEMQASVSTFFKLERNVITKRFKEDLQRSAFNEECVKRMLANATENGHAIGVVAGKEASAKSPVQPEEQLDPSLFVKTEFASALSSMGVRMIADDCDIEIKRENLS